MQLIVGQSRHTSEPSWTLVCLRRPWPTRCDFCTASSATRLVRSGSAGIQYPGDPNRTHEIRALTGTELQALIAAVPDDHLGPTDRILFLTAAMTGMRKGELQALRWMDIDWSARVIRVRRSYSFGEFTTPKSQRAARAVPMSKWLATKLASHRSSSEYRSERDLVFAHPQTGNPYDASKILKRFKRAMSNAGLREARFHDLRHTFGTQMAATGAPLRFIQEWMGHRDYKTTSIYADPDDAPSVVVGWELGSKGRKLDSACALLSPESDLLARSRAVWIALARTADSLPLAGESGVMRSGFCGQAQPIGS